MAGPVVWAGGFEGSRVVYNFKSPHEVKLGETSKCYTGNTFSLCA